MSNDHSFSRNHMRNTQSKRKFALWAFALAERMGDKTESICIAEWYLLRQIAERASDLVKGEHWDEFREACGGIDNLKAQARRSRGRYEKWISDGEG